MNESGNGRQPLADGQTSDLLLPDAPAEGSKASAVMAPIGPASGTGGLTFGAADEPELRARDELRQVTQSEIDRVIAAYEAWLVDVQTSFPNRIGPKLLSYAIQQTFRAWELSAPSQASTPGQVNAPMFPAVAIAEPETSAGPGELEAEAMLVNPKASDVLAGDETEPDSAECDGDVDLSEMLEGTVDLSVSANSAVGQVPSFLMELRRQYDLRLLQMRSVRSDGTTLITLSLRKPLPLKRVLLRMISVSEVDESLPDDAASEEPAFLHVRLSA